MSMKVSPALSELLGTQDIAAGVFNPNTNKNIKQNRYRSLMRGLNVLSYSTMGSLNSCDRKFQLKKLQLARDYDVDIKTPEGNIDFAFGKCVETGIQGAFLGKLKEQIWFDMYLAWDVPLDTLHPRYDKGVAKSFMDACLCIDKFMWIKDQLFQGWELAWFNGKPAIELAMVIDLGNGYWYAGHADIILYHRATGRYRVLEIKTTGAKYLHEAMYKNSDQSVGYSIMLDEIAKDLEESVTFEVYYLVFATSMDKWERYEFTKSRSMRAGWINTILLDIQRIELYKKVGFWPKRGGSCMSWGRPCEFIDTCDLDATYFTPTGDFAYITEEDIDQHQFDFKFNLESILKTQTELL